MAQHRTTLPLEPLLATGKITITQLAKRTGKHRAQVQRWKRLGVNIRQADILACSLNLHPTQVWGNDFYQPLSVKR